MSNLCNLDIQFRVKFSSLDEKNIPSRVSCSSKVDPSSACCFSTTLVLPVNSTFGMILVYYISISTDWRSRVRCNCFNLMRVQKSKKQAKRWYKSWTKVLFGHRLFLPFDWIASVWRTGWSILRFSITDTWMPYRRVHARNSMVVKSRLLWQSRTRSLVHRDKAYVGREQWWTKFLRSWIFYMRLDTATQRFLQMPLMLLFTSYVYYRVYTTSMSSPISLRLLQNYCFQ